MVHVACVAPLQCTLGEGPVWDEAGYLWFVDVKAPAVHRYRHEDGELRTWPLPEAVGALALRERGGLILAVKSGFAFFDPDTGALEPLFDPEPGRPDNRMNDAKCDALGRFWAGTMHDPEQAATGDLYRLDADLGCRRFPIGFTVTNGPAWSGDGRVFYFADSANRRIHAFDFDLDEGVLGEQRLFAEVPPEGGHPDGQTVDAEDHIWSARWDGSQVVRHRPDGSVALQVSLPVPLVTSCCFGGPDLSTLYVTTARVGLDDARLRAAPLSGGLFAVTGPGGLGAPVAAFQGLSAAMR